ncbi:MAG: S8 family serine peptidase, partial [Gammaproteobacteria bacterium]|nr:S8 family serine peptidase [Gammaproteobacteria bacterium]
PNVEYAEPNYIYSADSTIPNDFYFDRQWSLRNIGIIADGTPGADIKAVDAWDITTGSGSVVVAVLDTGIDYDHFDLVGNLWTNSLEDPNNGIDDDLNGYIDDWRGWDFTTCALFNENGTCGTPKAEDNDPFDDHGHGTHVAGTVGAAGNNGQGVTGVMWKVQLMPVKVLNANGFGTTADIINGIDYAVANGGIIMNASLGGTGFSQAMSDAISAAHTAGVLFAAAAGNESANNDINPHYPASYTLPNVISVAATDQNDMRVAFSNFGVTSVDVAAPGTYIFSTVPVWWEGFAGFGTLEFNSGTSVSTPHVAGLAGLLFSYYPHFTHSQVRGTIMR